MDVAGWYRRQDNPLLSKNLRCFLQALQDSQGPGYSLHASAQELSTGRYPFADIGSFPVPCIQKRGRSSKLAERST